MTVTDKYWLCDDGCTTDCGICKGAGRHASTTDRRAAEMARLDRLPAADEDTVERVARVIAEHAELLGSRTPWAGLSRASREKHRTAARAAIAELAAPGTGSPRGICQALTGCVNALDRHNRRCPAAPGTGSSGQAVQRVLDVCAELEAEAASLRRRTWLLGQEVANAATRIRSAVAGPQRDHGGESGQ